MFKKGKKGYTIYIFVEKCTKFENILKKGNNCTQETARKGPEDYCFLQVLIQLGVLEMLIVTKLLLTIKTQFI